MKHIPNSNKPLVLRTDFSNASLWESTCAAIRKPVGEFQAYVEFVSDPSYDGVTAEQVCALIPPDSSHTFIFLVDGLTLAHPDHPILVVDLDTEPGRSFRVIPAEMWAVENNLSIANMDFTEFADATGEDGIFRGFSQD